MANFSTNQVKNLFVAKSLKASNAHLASSDAAGTIAIPFAAAADEFYVEYAGPKDGRLRSDLIKTADIMDITAIKALSQKEYANSAYVACATPVAGQQYILRIKVKQFGGLAEEETCELFADYKAKSGDASKTVLANLAVLLAKNMKNLAAPLFNVYVTTESTIASVASANCTEVTEETLVSALTGDYKGIVIEAAAQPYRKGVFAQDNVYFVVSANKIISAGEEATWATVTTNTAHVAAQWLNNNKIKDLEYFCLGERGDIYRGVGFPNNFEAEYLAEDSTYGYDVITIHYAYVGDGENPQKSEKDLVLAIKNAGSDPNSGTNEPAYKIKAALATVTGKTITWR